jgi:Fe-Mn family superoxide dismutase
MLIFSQILNIKTMDKRTFLKTSILAGAGAMLMNKTQILAGTTQNAGVNINTLPFPQPPLPYSYDALEPYIDAKTMEIHYSKHHALYTKNFNEAVVNLKITTTNIKDIFKNTSKYPAVIRNMGGGYYNHMLFWEIMAPKAGGEPSGELSTKINKDFGSFAKFKEDFSKAAASVFGSGWAWLIERDGKLEITILPNQDNPLMDIAPVKGKPIFFLDVWEHAYYLKHQNRRPEYIEAFWNVVNWKKAEENLLKA